MRVRPLLGPLLAGLLAATLLTGCGTPATTGPSGSTTPTSTAGTSTRPPIPAYVVTAAHVKDNLVRTIVIDARADKYYSAGHIPGAINATWQLFAKVESGKAGDKGWGTLKGASEIGSILSQLGVDTRKQIVVYSSPGGWGEDGRIVWMLRMAGIANSVVLDGGYPAWTAAGFETSTDAVKLAPTTVEVKSLDQGWNVTTDEIVSGSGDLKIIDARTTKEYGGARDFGEARGGHLPGAVNVPFESLFKQDGTLKTPADLTALFDAVGVSTSDDIVVYCTKGIRSAYMTFILRGMGYTKTRNYDASFYEWAGNKRLDVVK
jgi:thiosulfate/3-mercaptopyruvate sulfurtransferase